MVISYEREIWAPLGFFKSTHLHVRVAPILLPLARLARVTEFIASGAGVGILLNLYSLLEKWLAESTLTTSTLPFTLPLLRFSDSDQFCGDNAQEIDYRT